MGFFSEEENSFLENRIFTYNKSRKIAFGIAVILGAFLLATFVLLYMGFWRHSDFFLVKGLNAFASSVTSSIGSSNLLGVFYTGTIGGLFFIFLPLEVLIGRALTAGNPLVYVGLVYIIGVSISYTINYFIGHKLSRISKKFISPKKFYSVKGKVNKYGGITIFIFNALPLPSQILAAILGVFRYNKTRFYFYLFLGQLTKVIIVAFSVGKLF